MSTRRSLAAGLALATACSLAAATAVSTGATAASPGANRLDRFGTHSTSSLDALTRGPLSLDRDARVRVIVTLKAAPVAAAKARALASGRTLSRSSEAAARAAVRDTQRGVAATISATGGRITYRYTDAINGFGAVIPVSAVRTLVTDPQVASVRRVGIRTLDNGRSNAYTGAAAAWQAYGVTGKGRTIAIIDDGIDYTHADFGGPGTPEAYEAIDRTTLAGVAFPTAKVVGGYDFVGDAYDAANETDPAIFTPKPDPNPLPCGEHGTHVAGTAAGQGVKADGTPYTGPYTQAAVEAAGLKVDPGSAPEAKLLALKVFGCDGSAGDDVILAAIDMAVKDKADVINMSLGSSYGTPDEPLAIASDNATRAGVVVVTSAGNSGHAPYLVGGPSTSRTAISVAAMNALPTFPGASIGVGAGIDAQNSNGADLSTIPAGAKLAVVRNGDGSVSLGCNVSDFTGVTGKVAVFLRGTCARVDKAKNAQTAGAVAAIMINSSPDLPPFEGAVPGLTIPFLGVAGPSGAALVAADGTAPTFTAKALTNPEFAQPADFTSGGPRGGDADIKPDLTAPGVSVVSAFFGSGSGSVTLSGTSMAAPHVAGIAALMKQKHPGWRAGWVKNALVSTASTDPSLLGGTLTIRGNGLVQPLKALQATVLPQPADWASGISFGVVELSSTGLDRTRRLDLRNVTDAPLTVNLTAAAVGEAYGARVRVFPSSLTIPANSTASAWVRVQMTAADLAKFPGADVTGSITPVVGQVTATPDRGPVATVPVQVFPKGRSDVQVTRSGSSLVANNVGLHSGDADVYQWLLSDGRDPGAGADVRSLGVQSFLAGDLSDVPGDKLLVFAVNTWNRHDNPASLEFDIPMDTDGDGKVDHVLFATDAGLVNSGDPNGSVSAFALNLATGDIGEFPALAASQGSTVLIPALASDLGISAASKPVTLGVQSFDITGYRAQDTTGFGAFDLWSLQRTTGDFETVAPGKSVTLPQQSKAPSSGETRSPGWMVVTLDDQAGLKQAALVTAP